MYKSEALKAFDSYFLVLKRYAQFSGRATRSEFWYFRLFDLFIGIVLSMLDMLGAIADSMTKLNSAHTHFGLTASLPMWTYALVVWIPCLSVQCRRLHDTNRSGWWTLLVFTLIGLIPLAIFLCQKSDPETNRFGEVPDPENADEKKISSLKQSNLEMIEKLSDLKDRGILTAEEFQEKKTELL